MWGEWVNSVNLLLDKTSKIMIIIIRMMIMIIMIRMMIIRWTFFRGSGRELQPLLRFFGVLLRYLTITIILTIIILTIITTSTIIIFRVETTKKLGVESRRWNAECCAAVSLLSRSTGRLSAILTGTPEIFRFGCLSKSYDYNRHMCWHNSLQKIYFQKIKQNRCARCNL